ncbi:unnamed protein product [Paramecium octaurelia]|uniref:Uncharacterized protein n=1 Tax=Paramecium octaurelia TaxID=43137 RepID=A0A8S1UCV7_PAROT|nr:unnamed protein product [Paramecium octaurelia]
MCFFIFYPSYDPKKEFVFVMNRNQLQLSQMDYQKNQFSNIQFHYTVIFQQHSLLMGIGQLGKCLQILIFANRTFANMNFFDLPKVQSAQASQLVISPLNKSFTYYNFSKIQVIKLTIILSKK